ncbi:signal peptidase II [Loigolactobacillus zhaoyuanensis]|uniref:Lipoprotein signal peptidase n=1 Tax=Loigolactobacillus zhaoyuanensis TaxID=2486017 RepID=A0ABW8UC36_9LACO|nr:signal peptidase II [Loigolactobacillus zhaoyuanensis]
MLYLILMAVVVGCDQLLKSWITTHLALQQVQNLIPNLLSLTYLRNNGAAWSILEGKQLFFLILTPLVILVLAYLLFKARHEQRLYALGLSFMIAGALGNFIDRLRFGYVVDMLQLDFINFPIFNLADSALTIGVILVFIYLIFFADEKE